MILSASFNPWPGFHSGCVTAVWARRSRYSCPYSVTAYWLPSLSLRIPCRSRFCDKRNKRVFASVFQFACTPFMRFAAMISPSLFGMVCIPQYAHNWLTVRGSYEPSSNGRRYGSPMHAMRRASVFSPTPFTSLKYGQIGFTRIRFCNESTVRCSKSFNGSINPLTICTSSESSA